MTETRRNSNGQILGPKVYDPRSYDERQLLRIAEDEVPVADTREGRVEVFLNRWHWRGPRDGVWNDEDAEMLVHRANAHEALVAALKAARQFVQPDISRGPGVNGWQNTVDMIEEALAKAEGR